MLDFSATSNPDKIQRADFCQRLSGYKCVSTFKMKKKLAFVFVLCYARYNMRKIRAVFENGVFKPLEKVDLPELTEVEFEPQVVRAEDLTNPNDLYTIFNQTFKAGGISPRKTSE